MFICIYSNKKKYIVEVTLLIPDFDVWALGVLESPKVPVTLWGHAHQYLSLHLHSAAQPSPVDLNQIRTCSCICQPGRAHNDVFIAALYQLQEEGWYLVWHKIYQDKITYKEKLKFSYVSRMVWYLSMTCFFFCHELSLLS